MAEQEIVDPGRLVHKYGTFSSDDGLCGDFEHLRFSELLAQIIGRLSIEQIFSLRCVCKSWYDGILDPRFTALYPKSNDAWALLEIQKWSKKDDDLVVPPKKASVKKKSQKITPPAPVLAVWSPSSGSFWFTDCFVKMDEDCCTACTAGGLVCTGAGNQVSIFNPITKECRKLPRLPEATHVCAVHMKMLPVGYEVVAFYEAKAGFHTMHYVSAERQWYPGGFASWGLEAGDQLQGEFFLIEDNILGYSMQSRRWCAAYVARSLQHTIVSAFQMNENIYGAYSTAEDEQADEEEDDDGEEGSDVELMSRGVGINFLIGEEKLAWDVVSDLPNAASGNPDHLHEDITHEATRAGSAVFIYKSNPPGNWFPVMYEFATEQWYSLAQDLLKRNVSLKKDDVRFKYAFQPSIGARV